MKRLKKTAAAMLSAAMALSSAGALSVNASAEWVKSGAGYSYKDDGTGERLTGWQTVAGEKYYFDKDGIALTGWKKINGSTYYFNASKRGRMLTGWVKINGERYYFGSDGAMRTGWIKIKGNTYYFDSEGIMLTGTHKIGGRICTFGDDGVLTETAEDGSFTIDSVAEGLKFGMTMEEVSEKMPYRDNPSYAGTGILMVDLDGSDSLAAYVFDADGGLCSYSVMFTAETDRSPAEALFENADWEDMGDTGSGRVYVSPDYAAYGIAMTNDGVTSATVYSYDLLEEFMYGNDDALAHVGV
ncbi:MAG: hypothetical protein NC078_12885 [Ruminococcus sp.]|nr:hypothetical protein [Ruminococcus sp.]